MSTLLIICMSFRSFGFKCHQVGGGLMGTYFFTPNGSSSLQGLHSFCGFQKYFAHTPLLLGIVFNVWIPSPYLSLEVRWFLLVHPAFKPHLSMKQNKVWIPSLWTWGTWPEPLAEEQLTCWKLVSCAFLSVGAGGPVPPQARFVPITYNPHLSQIPFSWLHQIELPALIAIVIQ